MRLKFIVEVELEHAEGKFESLDDLADEITVALDDADPGDVTGQNEGLYNVTEWEVSRA